MFIANISLFSFSNKWSLTLTPREILDSLSNCNITAFCQSKCTFFSSFEVGWNYPKCLKCPTYNTKTSLNSWTWENTNISWHLKLLLKAIVCSQNPGLISIKSISKTEAEMQRHLKTESQGSQYEEKEIRHQWGLALLEIWHQWG